MPALIRLAWPIVVSMLSVSTMTLVDTLFVSQLGAGAVAGVGLAGVLVFALWCFPMGTVRAVKILVSQSVGAGHREEHGPYLGAALATAVSLGLAVAVIGTVGAPALKWLTETERSGQFACDYLRVRAWCSSGFLALVAIRETRQGLSDSRSVMYAMLLSNALNIALDYTFILQLHWGVEGAAWASNLSIFAELALIGWLHARRDGFRLSEARGLHLRQLLTLGIPSGIQLGLEVSSFSLMVAILASFSEAHAAANQIGIQVLHFAFLPAVAFAEAGSVFAGQAVGAGCPQLVPTIARLTLRLALLYAVVCGLTFYFGAEPIVSAFTQDPKLQALTTRLFGILAVFQLIDATYIVARGVLRGAGDVRFVALVGVVAAWVFTPTLTYALGYRLGWGVYGAWAGVSLEVVIATAVLWRRLHLTRFQAAPQSMAAATP